MVYRIGGLAAESRNKESSGDMESEQAIIE